MVVRGRGKYPQRKTPELPSPTPNIIKIASLKKQPASDKALELLHEVATLVTPIMHHYNFKVTLLCEMYPKNQGLLGLNVNRGQKICLRLRSPTDSKWFLERDEIVGTMLHELTHNWHGPHNQKFYKTLDELKDKYFEFQVSKSLKNSTYPNNFSHTMGSSKKTTQSKYTTRITKLGTNSTNSNGNIIKNLTMRDLMLQAAERRLNDAKKCIELENDKYKNVPEDSELTTIDVILLDSEEEEELQASETHTQHGSKITTKVNPDIKKEPNTEIIYID